jgi:transposase
MKRLDINKDSLSHAGLEKLYRATKSARLAIRYLAILKLYEGQSTYEAAAEVHVTPQVVVNWVHRWNEGGPDALVESGHTGRPPYLTPEQQQELANHVIKPPRENGHDFNVWYLKNIAGHAAEKYDVVYSVSGIYRLRKRNTLVYRVPRTEPVGGDQKKGRLQDQERGDLPRQAAWGRDRAPRRERVRALRQA